MKAREIKFRAWDGKRLHYFELSDTIASPLENHVMQFTGLTDKNGTDIYEDDLVQHDAWDYPFEVFFNQEKARFVCKLKTGLTQHIDYERLVVIGNIHENPELLKKIIK